MPDAPPSTWIDSPWLVPFDGSFRGEQARTGPPRRAPGKRALEERLDELGEEIERWQRRLWAEDRRALLLVFQALDAAGKDGTIRAVLRGVDPAGCHVTSFKAPNAEELDHDFLWRTARHLPRRGAIGVFNRSWYEEVLVVRVHPELLAAQRVAVPADLDELWAQRLAAIADHERHLAQQGTVVVKFWLHVSRDEQRKRLLKRIDDPDRNWKFEERDVHERARWADYQAAYRQAVAATSRPWAPWYVIPADSKPYMRVQVAELVAATLARMAPDFPAVSEARRQELRGLRGLLADD